MKKLFLLIIVIIAAMSSAFIGTPPYDELALNAAMPSGSYKMKDVSGKEVSLNEAKTGKGLLVIFSCNTCPYVKLSETRIKEYSDLCLANGIGCIIVNSNEAKRKKEDSF